MNRDPFRSVLADVAREIIAAPEPPGVSVTCIYDAAEGEPDESIVEQAARGRRIAVRTSIPDNGRDRDPMTLPLPRFRVSTPEGVSWQWSPTSAEGSKA